MSVRSLQGSHALTGRRDIRRSALQCSQRAVSKRLGIPACGVMHFLVCTRRDQGRPSASASCVGASARTRRAGAALQKCTRRDGLSRVNLPAVRGNGRQRLPYADSPDRVGPQTSARGGGESIPRARLPGCGEKSPHVGAFSPHVRRGGARNVSGPVSDRGRSHIRLGDSARSGR